MEKERWWLAGMAEARHRRVGAFVPLAVPGGGELAVLLLLIISANYWATRLGVPWRVRELRPKTAELLT